MKSYPLTVNLLSCELAAGSFRRFSGKARRSDDTSALRRSEISSARGYWKRVDVKHDQTAQCKRVAGLWKTLSMKAFDQLREVQCNGALAQAERASELLLQIKANPENTQLEVEASALFDAYLNDPYLIRNQES